jgi:hypothetical protein
MYACGLASDLYELSAWILPRWLEGHSDESSDSIAPIVRKSDGQRGIAICRGGSWLSVLGYGANDTVPLKSEYYSLAQYLKKMEAWEVRHDADTRKDLLILSQVEKSEVSIVWNGSKFISRLAKHNGEN